MAKVIGYQVQDANGYNWADRPSYLILGLQTASADLQAARACSDRLFFMIAVLEGDIENPEFEQSRGFISDEMGMIHVCMTDVVDDYDVPDDVPEWLWIEEVASYKHIKNGQSGVWEFIVNLAYGMDDAPEKLKPMLEAAKNSGAGYVLFHQGT